MDGVTVPISEPMEMSTSDIVSRCGDGGHANAVFRKFTGMKFVTVVILPLATVAVAVWLVLYLRYRASPVAQWAARVRKRRSEFVARVRSLESANARNIQTDPIRKELWNEHLRSLPVSEAIAYDGIGQATVDKLREAGLKSVRDMMGYEFQRIPGFGPVKSEKLQNAVNQILDKAQKQFDSGTNPHGQEYRRRVAELKARDQAEKQAREQTITLIRAVMTQMQPQFDAACQVGLIQHTMKRAIPGLTEELMARPILEVPRDVPVIMPAAKPDVKPAELPANPAPAPLPMPESVSAEPSPVSRSSDPRIVRMSWIAQLGILCGKADGRLAKAERTVLREFLASDFGNDPLILRHIDPQIERAENTTPDESTILQQIKSTSSVAERKKYFDLARNICNASGELNPREAELLARIRQAWEMTETEHVTGSNPVTPVKPSEVPREAKSALLDARAVLEIEPKAELTVELIRRRFTLLTERADPDKAAKLGADFAAMAARKREEIRAAAELLIQPFHVPLDPPPLPPPPTDIRHNPDLDDIFG